MRDTLRIHYANTARSGKWFPANVSWNTFIESKVAKPLRTGEAFADFCVMDKDEKNIYKDVGGYVFGELHNNSRAAKNIISRNVVCLDLDTAPYDLWQRIKYFPFEMVMHSTHSHSPEKPRYRLLIPLDRDVTPDEYEAIGRKIAENVGIDFLDPTTFQPNRLMYFPSVSRDGEYVFERKASDTWLSADSVLGMYREWRDITQWTFHKGHEKHIAPNEKRKDPREKKDAHGAFCRLYSISDAIEKFLPEVYVSSVMKDRYTYTKGSSGMGLVVYDDLWAYSHHSTDPANSKLLSAAELVQIHEFGGFSGDEKDDKENYLAFEEKYKNLPEVKAEIMTRVLSSDAISDYFDVISDEDKAAREFLLTLLDTDSKGKILPTYDNFYRIFSADPLLSGKFHWCQLAHDVEVDRTSAFFSSAMTPYFCDEDAASLRVYLGRVYNVESSQKIWDIVMDIAAKNARHPIQEYVKSIKWDGVVRIPTLLHEYLDVEDSAYSREAIRSQLVGAVKRVFEPGCKHDKMLVLYGEEETGKSTFIHTLGLDFKRDSEEKETAFSKFAEISSFNPKILAENLRGKWIIEAAELTALNKKADVEEVKQMITCQTDRFRAAFERKAKDNPRQCIFFGTTNRQDFLTSDTGNRRFVICEVRLKKGVYDAKKSVTDDLPKEVDQIWAEAYLRYKAGESNIMSKKAFRPEDENVSEQYMEYDPYVEQLQTYLDTPVPDNYYEMSLNDRIAFRNNLRNGMKNKNMNKITYVSVREFWSEGLGNEMGELDVIKSRSIGRALNKLKGVLKRRNVAQRSKAYGIIKVYDVLCSTS